MTEVEYDYVPRWFIAALWLAVIVLAAYSFFSTLELLGILSIGFTGVSPASFIAAYGGLPCKFHFDVTYYTEVLL